MKSPLAHLESEFDRLLDSYCLELEQGQIIEAEFAGLKAEDFFEAVQLLKLNRAFTEESFSTGESAA